MRLRIWKFALTHKGSLAATAGEDGLLRACHQTRDEGLAVFYGSNTFHFDGKPQKLPIFCKHNATMMLETLTGRFGDLIAGQNRPREDSTALSARLDWSVEIMRWLQVRDKQGTLPYLRSVRLSVFTPLDLRLVVVFTLKGLESADLSGDTLRCVPGTRWSSHTCSICTVSKATESPWPRTGLLNRILMRHHERHYAHGAISKAGVYAVFDLPNVSNYGYWKRHGRAAGRVYVRRIADVVLERVSGEMPTIVRWERIIRALIKLPMPEEVEQEQAEMARMWPSDSQAQDLASGGAMQPILIPLFAV